MEVWGWGRLYDPMSQIFIGPKYFPRACTLPEWRWPNYILLWTSIGEHGHRGWNTDSEDPWHDYSLHRDLIGPTRPDPNPTFTYTYKWMVRDTTHVWDFSDSVNNFQRLLETHCRDDRSGDVNCFRLTLFKTKVYSTITATPITSLDIFLIKSQTTLRKVLSSSRPLKDKDRLTYGTRDIFRDGVNRLLNPFYQTLLNKWFRQRRVRTRSRTTDEKWQYNPKKYIQVNSPGRLPKSTVSSNTLTKIMFTMRLVERV